MPETKSNVQTNVSDYKKNNFSIDCYITGNNYNIIILNGNIWTV